MVRYDDSGAITGEVVDEKRLINPVKDSPADRSKEIHLSSDVDVSTNSQHHTLGTQPTQAAPGSHKHDNLYAGVHHSHGPDDLPEIIIPDELIVSPTDPLLDNPDLEDGTAWIDSSIPDATYQVISAIWENDQVTINSTTFAHPAKWGDIWFTAPDDGALTIWANCDFDGNTLTNNREAQWRLRVYDVAGVAVKGRTVRDDRTRVYTLDNSMACAVSRGESYRIALEFAMSHSNATSFKVQSPKATLMYLPRAVFTEITVETDP